MSLLVFGAGAIGRGYLPWVFPPDQYEYRYVEADPMMRTRLSESGRFTTFKTVNGEYEALEVPVAECLAPGESASALSKVDAVITAVGPRNVRSLGNTLRGLSLPVVCCENDSAVPRRLAAATGNARVVLGIPDVIASNTAPDRLLAVDPLGLVTEDGECFVDQAVSDLGGNCHYVDEEELDNQWRAKLYIHNTPHCIAAYLGSVRGVSYLHEAMDHPRIHAVVQGVMDEMARMLELRYRMNQGFVRWYSGKELRRFSNTLLYDPVARVAREPFRKLAHNDRLIGAAELCLSCGVVPENVILGIMAAFWYEASDDPDINIRYLRAALEPSEFLRMIIRLRPGEALYEIVLDRWDQNVATLSELRS
ncbi:MAG TPA: hypothetical protein VES65_03290 [Solirubrobacteraceae bacterium]|nr:hypothetical protein [Solirubrobacteraceae bacterium]